MRGFFSLQLVIVFLVVVLGSLANPSHANAIIVLPAIILIPVAKILALILGGFALPAVGIGALWAKINEKPMVKGILFALISLLVGALIFGLILKAVSPERPLI